MRKVRNEIRKEAGPGEDEPEDAPPFTPRAHRVLAMSVYHADDYSAEQVQEPHLLLALLQEGEGVAVRKLTGLGISIDIWMEMILDDLERVKSNGESVLSQSGSAEADPSKPTRLPTPLLDKYGRDLTELARKDKISRAIGREREIRAVARTLTRSQKNKPL